MKIGLDVSQIVYQGTGVGRYTYNLAHALLEKGGAEFVFYAGALRRLSELKKLSRAKIWNQASWKIYPLPPKVAERIFHHTPLSIDPFLGHVDIFHSSDWTQPGSRAIKVTTVHDLVFKKYPETVDPLILHSQTRRMDRVVKEVDLIVADSVSTKNDLVKIYQLDPEKIEVVYPGIEARFSPQKSKEIARVKIKYHLPDNFILSVGTQEPRKNLARLVEAAKLADLPLVLTGRHGWGQETATLGYVPDSDLPALYSSASVFAYPSLYEGFGFPVGEAMACGVPVVTSNISSLPEVGGTAAVLVDPQDVNSIATGINLAVKEKTKRGKAGLVQAKNFTWEKSAQEMLILYRKVANENRD